MVMKILDIGIKIIETLVIIFAVIAIMFDANRRFNEARRERDRLDNLLEPKRGNEDGQNN